MKNLLRILILTLILVSCKKETEEKIKLTKSEFKSIKIDTTLLFGTWGIDKKSDAVFKITNKKFYVVDFFETSTYSLEKKKLIIHNSDYYREGLIINVTKDTLKIKWDLTDDVWNYWRFKN